MPWEPPLGAKHRGNQLAAPLSLPPALQGRPGCAPAGIPPSAEQGRPSRSRAPLSPPLEVFPKSYLRFGWAAPFLFPSLPPSAPRGAPPRTHPRRGAAAPSLMPPRRARSRGSAGERRSAGWARGGGPGGGTAPKPCGWPAPRSPTCCCLRAKGAAESAAGAPAAGHLRSCEYADEFRAVCDYLLKKKPGPKRAHYASAAGSAQHWGGLKGFLLCHTLY